MNAATVLPAQSHPGLVLLVFIPLLGAILSVMLDGRAARSTAVITLAGVFGALWWVSADVMAATRVHHLLGGWGAPLGIELMADGLSLAMLWLTWVIGLAVSAVAPAWFGGRAEVSRLFWPLWFMLWAALNATWLATDLFNLYITLELMTLSAVALAILGGGPAALRAGMRYLLYALLGSLAWLLGVALIYAGHGVLDLQTLGAGLEVGPAAWFAAAMMSVGLMAKAALWPLHGWLPPAHAGAPAPVSALLSALVVKAAVYLLLRLWWWGLPALTGQGVAIAFGVLGAAAMLYGSMLALVQLRLKRIIAYSTIAQLGYLLLVFPLASMAAWQGVLYHALSHGVAKAAMFLAAGNILLVVGHDRLAGLPQAMRARLGPSVAGLVLASVSLMGLPPTGGFIAKWLLLRAAFETGGLVWVGLIVLSGLLAAAYLFRLLAMLLRRPAGGEDDCVSRGNDTAPLPAILSVMPLMLGMLAVLLGFVADPLLRLFLQGAPFAQVAP